MSFVFKVASIRDGKLFTVDLMAGFQQVWGHGFYLLGEDLVTDRGL